MATGANLKLSDALSPLGPQAINAMVRPEGFALIAELIAAACLVVALLGFSISRSRLFFVASVAAFAALIVAGIVVAELSS
jgi:hypothetical protein